MWFKNITNVEYVEDVQAITFNDILDVILDNMDSEDDLLDTIRQLRNMSENEMVELHGIEILCVEE